MPISIPLISFNTLDPIIPSAAYDTYWKFAFLRQEVFFNRLLDNEDTSNDAIIAQYKFTNAYRCLDRVSQFLIKEVIYQGQHSVRDTFLRIILFKLFNKISTWELLTHRFGTICEDNFSVEKYRGFLDSEMNKGRVLYSNAYMMASGCKEFNVTRKHQSHLLLVEKMLKESLPEKIEQCNNMQEAYGLLLAYPLIGNFLAYQYITDINYSDITNYSETEFTIPGPGSKDGIRKCFLSLGGLTETEIIKVMTDRQEIEFERLGLKFRYIDGRRLQYIDIQNIFCETDKYCRVAHPEIQGISGRKKIKQLFKANSKKVDYFFPPKWNINLRNLYGDK